MKIFCLYGIDQTEKIQLIWNENYEYSKKFYDGVINCTLQIDIGCYHVEMEQYYSEARALLGFASALRNCCKTMQGTAEYDTLMDEDLLFSVIMTKNGHAVVKGRFQERPDKDTALNFEMETDQRCMALAARQIDDFESIYNSSNSK